MRVALSARVSPHDQHTLAMHMDALRAFATRCGWTVIDTSAAMGSGATDHRSKHPALLHAARQDAGGRVGALDWWGRMLADGSGDRARWGDLDRGVRREAHRCRERNAADRRGDPGAHTLLSAPP